jgi:hypothetical protein
VRTNDFAVATQLRYYLKPYISDAPPWHVVDAIISKAGDIERLRHTYAGGKSCSLLEGQENKIVRAGNELVLVFDRSVIQKSKDDRITLVSVDPEEIVLLAGIVALSYFDQSITQRRGYILHAASSVYRDRGVLIVGDKFSGKTSTLISLLKLSATEFMSNDRTYFFSAGDRGKIMARASRTAKVGYGTCTQHERLKAFVPTWFSEQASISLRHEKIVFQNLDEILDVRVRCSADLNLVLMPDIGAETEQIEASEIDLSEIVRNSQLAIDDGVSIANELFEITMMDCSSLKGKKVRAVALRGKKSVCNAGEIVKELL